jgi:hypothetical protein
MSGGLQTFLRTVDPRIGWGRIGVVLSLTIITVAGIVLYRMLREINFEDVVDAVEAVEKHDVVKAAVFVAAGYFTLTLYDLFALRTIERPDIPYRVRTGGIHEGHNVGASAFTGGAVRYRIYSRYGLSAIDVAKVCFIAALTFWLRAGAETKNADGPRRNEVVNVNVSLQGPTRKHSCSELRSYL